MGADGDTFAPGYDLIRDEGTDENRRGAINFIGAGVSVADDSANNETEVTIGGGGSSNSFETLSVPAGTNPVADSATDTLTLTETTPFTITGTAGTDTIDLTVEAGADFDAAGLIEANAVALGTDTTNAYVADLTAGTYIDVSGGGAETATVTVDVDATEIEAVTFGAGGNASNLWTINLSGTDPTLNWVSGGATLVGTMTADGLTVGSDEFLTMGADTLEFDATTNDFELSDDLTLTDTGPHLRLTDSTAGDDDWEFSADLDTLTLARTDGTTTTDVMLWLGTNAVRVPNLVSCDTIDTNAAGLLSCGTDSGGGGNSFETLAVPAGA